MKPSDFFSALLTFFNDFVGVAAPGFVFVTGSILMHPSITSAYKKTAELHPEGLWIVGIVTCYAVGHLLLALHLAVKELMLKLPIFKNEQTETSSYLAFRKVVKKKLKKLDVNDRDIRESDLRSLAMSVSPEAAELGRRFMFISLFCNGVGASLCGLALLSFLPGVSEVGSNWWARGVLVVVAGFLFWRGGQFVHRALNVPFPIALSTVLFDKSTDTAEVES